MLLIHAHLYTMQPSDQGFVTYPDGFVLTEGDKIAAVGTMDACPDLSAIAPDQVIDLAGTIVCPGFIDAHCHMGLAEEGLNFEGDDLNEITDPVTPHLRGIDAINPLNRSFDEAVDAAVTTVVTGPGSANAIGGQFAAIKTFGRNVDRMILRAPVAMKFALGENPKNCYNDKSETPMTRMATAALIREQLQKAIRYDEDLLKSEEDEDTDPPDFDAKCDALLPVIRGELKAHFHCHRADDIFTAIRIAKEFSLDYVLVHCTEGHLIAEELAEEKARVITGPLMTTRSKPELRNATDKNPGVLSKAGVPCAICTDYNVMPIGMLPICAGMAVREGMDYLQALAAITIHPAQIVGIDDRVGSLVPGKDADLAVFCTDPLTIAAKPALVMINGKIVRR